MMLRGRVALKRAVAGARSMAAVHGVTPLAEHDPAMNSLLQQEAERQKGGLELIAKEWIDSQYVFGGLYVHYNPRRDAKHHS